ncbi:MAG: hypothetical protein ACOC1F_11610 [Myxococcota bacterium]
MKRTAHGKRNRSSWKNVSNRRNFKPLTVTTDLGGNPAFFTLVDERSRKAVTTYFEAHALLPRRMQEGMEPPQPTIREAIEVLQDEQSDADALLRAIVILGHVPTPSAHDALKRHAASGRTHADVAVVAADECAGWMAQENPWMSEEESQHEMVN